MKGIGIKEEEKIAEKCSKVILEFFCDRRLMGVYEFHGKGMDGQKR